MLASDINNKEFAGAVNNPDELLHVEFYWHEPIDKWESEAKGKIVKGPKQPFVRIMRPGDQLSIIEVPVQDHHKLRWPQKWMAWQIKEGLLEGEHKIPGWPLEEWSEITTDQVHELKYLRFSTVEQLAGASDTAIMRLGMGGLGLRERAKLALKNKMGAEVKAELEAKDKLIAEQGERLKRLEQAVMAMSTPASPQPPQPEAPKKRGRPKKVQTQEQPA